MMQFGLPPVISFTGVGQVGKTELAKHLREHHGYGGDHINEPMVAMAIPLLERMGCTTEDAISRLTTSRKAESIPGYEWLSGRVILQSIGLDLRNALGQFTDKEKDVEDESFFLDMWARRHSSYARLVNESARYPVEIDWTADRGGIVIRVDSAHSKPANGHVSETTVLPYDYLLFNDFDGLPKLHAKLHAILAQWSSPDSLPWDLAERRQLQLFTDGAELCMRIDGEVRYGDQVGRQAFETLEGQMAETLMIRTRDRYPHDQSKVVQMEEWLEEQRGLQRNRAALVIGHFGIDGFNARYSALRAA